MDAEHMFSVTKPDTVVFTDTLGQNSPYYARKPRDHESLFFVTDGDLLYRKNGEEAVVKKGQIGYVARGSVDFSGPFACKSVSYIAMNFRYDRETAKPAATLPFRTVCSDGIARRYEGLFREALGAYRTAAPGYEAICSGILLQIIGFLYQEQRMTAGDRKKVQRLAPAIALLQCRFADAALQIRELAACCGMSEKNFRRLFHDAYGNTPYGFLQEYRIRQAETMLQSTNRTVSEIALACGFSDVFGFSHCFKRHRGVSPAEYRTR